MRSEEGKQSPQLSKPTMTRSWGSRNRAKPTRYLPAVENLTRLAANRALPQSIRRNRVCRAVGTRNRARMPEQALQGWLADDHALGPHQYRSCQLEKTWQRGHRVLSEPGRGLPRHCRPRSNIGLVPWHRRHPTVVARATTSAQQLEVLRLHPVHRETR